MQALGLGKITVAAAGTAVPFTTTQVRVRKVTVTFDPADTTATIYVKDKNGAIMAALTSASSAPVTFGDVSGNPLDLSTLSMDSSVNGKGGFVAYEVS